jgi:cytidine deaminase
VSGSPFRADPALAERRTGLVDDLGPLFDGRLAAARAAGGVDPVHPRAVIPATVTADLVAQLDLRSVEELMLLALETARALARPPVSGYRVGAVGLATPSGDLLLGGNLELPGATIWTTVHGEGSVTMLARARGQTITTLALSQARPCAHCRQVLAEMDGAHGDAVEGGQGEGLVLIDPAGRRLRLADIYPWPFAPGDLGMRGAVPGTLPFPALALADVADAAEAVVPADVARALEAAGRRSHAPYSGTPAAVVVRLQDGALVAGSVMENVAFNPSLGPVQEALVVLLASGREPADVAEGWLAVPREGGNAHEAVTRDALAAAAPGARLHVTYWA